jgi:toxin ParE1/3/4
VAGTRELVAVWPCIVIYEVRQDQGAAVILRIWHGAQDRPCRTTTGT